MNGVLPRHADSAVKVDCFRRCYPTLGHPALLDWQREFNRQVNKIRWVIEQVIANFKTWRMMHTDYRRPIEIFAETVSAVIGLEFYRMA